MRNLMWLAAVALVLGGARVRAEEDSRDGFRFGIGVGYVLPANLNSPNLTVASFFYKGLEIQPSVVFKKTTSKSDDSVTKSKDVQTQNGAGVTIRAPFSRRTDVDFQFIGALNYSSSMADPEGPNNKTTSKQETASYGLGLEWWFVRNFSLTATATNPLYDRTHTRADDITGPTTTTDVSYGIVWDPKISFVLTMWF